MREESRRRIRPRRRLYDVFLVFILQDMSLKCNEEGKSLSTETFTKVSLTNLRRPAVPDLASDLGMNIFKKVRQVFELEFICGSLFCA